MPTSWKIQPSLSRIRWDTTVKLQDAENYQIGGKIDGIGLKVGKSAVMKPFGLERVIPKWVLSGKGRLIKSLFKRFSFPPS